MSQFGEPIAVIIIIGSIIFCCVSVRQLIYLKTNNPNGRRIAPHSDELMTSTTIRIIPHQEA